MSTISLVSLCPKRVAEHTSMRLNRLSELTNELIDFYSEQLTKEKTNGMFKKCVYKNFEQAREAAIRMEPMQNIKQLYHGESVLLLSIKKEAEKLVEQGIAEYQVPHTTLIFLGDDFKNYEPKKNSQIRLEKMNTASE